MLIVDIRDSFPSERKRIVDDVTGFNMFGCVDFASEEKAIAFLRRLNYEGYVIYDGATDTLIGPPYIY